MSAFYVCAWCQAKAALVYEWFNGIRRNRMPLCPGCARRAKRQHLLYPVAVENWEQANE